MNNQLRFNKKRTIIIAVIIIVLIAAGIALPYVALNYANKKLANLNSLYGHIDDIDIALYRGGFEIKGFFLNKKDSISGQQTRFFESDIIDISIEWSALLKGRLVREIVVERPYLTFTKGQTEPNDIQKDSADLKSLISSLPLKLNRVEIKDGIIKYVDLTSKPAVDIHLDSLYVIAQNLSSVVDTAMLPSTVEAYANIYSGTLRFNMKLNALKDNPTFDLNAELKNMQLPELNEFFQAYANFDVNKGTLGLFTEIAAKEGEFIGYVKPIIKDLDVVGKEDRKNSFWQKIWESIVGAGGVILSNPKKEQVATKLPLSGTFDNPNSNIWYAVIDLLRNAFVEALQPSIDAEINIDSVDKEIAKNKPKK